MNLLRVLSVERSEWFLGAGGLRSLPACVDAPSFWSRTQGLMKE